MQRLLTRVELTTATC